MNKFMKLILSLLIMFSCIPSYNIYAEEENYGVIESDYEPEDRNSESSPYSRAGDALDYTSYSSETTDVKDQGDYETCWAFSYIAMAETYMISSGEEDLSERQLAYFAYNNVDDPLGNTTGDSSTINNSSYTYLTLGGNAYYASMLLSGFCGTIDEEDAPYDGYSSMSDLDDEYGFNYNTVLLTDAYFMDDASTEEIKEAIYNNGSVVGNYYHSSSYYDSSTGAYYCNVSKTINHAICIVGWDDDYDFSDSSLTSKPSSAGAWLVKNSWGDETGDNGYTWISYEDKNLSSFVTSEFVDASTYDHNYHYDGTIGLDETSISSGSSISNIYQVSGNDNGSEVLNAVSFAIDSTDVDYSIQIYTDLDDTSNPESGSAALSEELTGTTTYSGIYSVDLDEEVILEEGTYFSVVITLTSSYNKKINVFVESDYSDSTFTFEGNAQKNQSFYKSGNSWSDFYTVSGGICARIKAFTNDVDSAESDEDIDFTKATITLKDTSYTYTGYEIEPSITVSYNGTTLTSNYYTVEYSNNTDVGTATITVTGKNGYSGTVTKTFTITQASMSDVTVASIANQYYTGSAIKPSPTITYGRYTLTSGTDYTLSYSNNTSVGTATITITGKGNFTGTTTKTFKIVSKSLSSATVTLSTTSYTYNGSARTPTPTVKLNGTTLTKGTDYTVSYSDNINAGTATVTITGIDNYSGTATKTFTINKASMSSATITLGYTSKTYTGSALKPSVTVKLGSTKISSSYYTLSYSSNTNAGTAYVKITGKTNLSGSVTKSFTIKKRSLSGNYGSATLSTTTYTYNGSTRKPSVTVYYNGSKVSSSYYTVTYASGRKNAGVYKVTIKGKTNYSGTITKYFYIKPKKVTISSAKSSASKKLTVKWKKPTGGAGSGYQIAYRKKGSSTWKYKKVSSSTLSKTLTGLTKGKYYYVKVRGYVKNGSTYKYGTWSSTKTVKVK